MASYYPTGYRTPQGFPSGSTNGSLTIQGSNQSMYNVDKTGPFIQITGNPPTGLSNPVSLVANSSTLNQAHYHDFSSELESSIRRQINSLGHPSTFGPGEWRNIHTLAKWANSQERIDTYIMIVQVIVSTLMCLDCRKHATKFFEDNNPREYSLVKDCRGRLIGMFLWSWKFHNTVNARLGKQILDFDTAFNMYPDYDQIILNAKEEIEGGGPCDGPCPSIGNSSSASHSTALTTSNSSSIYGPYSPTYQSANGYQSRREDPKTMFPNKPFYRAGGY